MIGLYFGFGTYSIRGAVNRLVDNVFVPSSQANAFEVDGTDHTLLGSPGRVTSGGVLLRDWVEAWRDHNAGWADAL